MIHRLCFRSFFSAASAASAASNGSAFRANGGSFFCSLLAVLLFISLSFYPLSSRAVTGAITVAGINYVNSDGSTDNQTRSYITGVDTTRIFTDDDCVNDRGLKVPFTATSWTSDADELQVWVGPNGADCTSSTQRSGSTQQCWRVNKEKIGRTGNQLYITVKNRDLLAQNKTSVAYVAANSSVCDTPTEATFTIYFLFVNGVDAQGPTLTVKVDSLGPDSPTSVSAGPGDGRLIVSWALSSNTSNVVGYKIYCADGTANQNIAQNNETNVDASASLADSGSGTSAASDSTSSSDGSNTSSCNLSTTSGLVANSVPTQDKNLPAGIWVCGTAGQTTATSADVSTLANGSRLQNGAPYWVAVAGYDLVGNVGALSPVACGIPQNVTEFFDIYRAYGGAATGCSLQLFSTSNVLFQTQRLVSLLLFYVMIFWLRKKGMNK